MNWRTMLRFLIPLLILLIPVTIYLSPELAAGILSVIGFLAPLWLPLLLAWIAWPLWLTFVRSHYVMNIPYSTIELKPGPETPRTAKAMELVFYSLYHRTDVEPLAHYFLGQVRVPWSFEIVAHGGTIRFFVHLPTAHREAVETRIRSEYRDIDIDQVRDYSREVAFDPYSMTLLMKEYALTKPDPYPVRTYVADESLRRDRFAEFLEGLLTLGDDEYLYVSLLVRPHQREREGFFGASRDSLHEDAQKAIVSLLGAKGDINAVSEDKKKTILAIESALKKPSFDCGVRALYMAKRTHAREDAQNFMENLLQKFSDADANSFEAYDPLKNINYLMAEFLRSVPAFAGDYFMNLYRRRAFFAPPYYGTSFILNTEELATMFHIPHYARASGLANIRGVRIEAPENLPV